MLINIRSCSRALVIGLGLIAVPSAALAAPDVERDKPALPEKPEERKTVALEVNPIGIAIGHYSVSVEWLPLAHHALQLSPHFDYVSADVESGKLQYSQKFIGGGTELGYRFYTASKGPAGFYVGPSFLFGQYSASQSNANDSVAFTTLGGALDVGGQAVIGPGIVIGAGAGVQYTKATKDFTDLPLSAAVLAGGGVRPRFLLSLGYAL